jgi:hypothetical protein
MPLHSGYSQSTFGSPLRVTSPFSYTVLAKKALHKPAKESNWAANKHDFPGYSLLYISLVEKTRGKISIWRAIKNRNLGREQPVGIRHNWDGCTSIIELGKRVFLL